VYAWCEARGLPVIVHCGTSTFAGSANAYGNPELLDPVFRDFPGLTVVLAHGGRGWWYDQAAFLALMRPSVWLEVSGLPPRRLPDYYGSSLRRLASKMIFGTDWPGVPGVQANARALEKVLLEAGCTAGQVEGALGGNAAAVLGLVHYPRASRGSPWTSHARTPLTAGRSLFYFARNGRLQTRQMGAVRVL